jgi:hypothetical protein
MEDEIWDGLPWPEVAKLFGFDAAYPAAQLMTSSAN